MPCPVAPVNDEEKSSDSSKSEPSNDSLSDLVGSIALLVRAIDQQNSLLMEFLDRTAEQDEEAPKLDLAGRPLKR